MPKRFRAILIKDDKTEGTAVVMPFDVQREFGTRGRVPVRGTINRFAFRSTLSPYSGTHYLPVNRAVREGAKAKAGNTVTVVLERDDEPRSVTAPHDLQVAIYANQAEQAAWDKLSYSHRKAYAQVIEEAKKLETRARRIEKAITALAKPKPRSR